MTTAPGTGTRATTWIAALATVLLCAPWMFSFEFRSTDLSALRVVDGDVPYRDFWSMYAPGSYLFMAFVFRALGEQLVWSNLLGVVTTAAAVATLHRLVSRGSPGGLALPLAIVFLLAFIQSGYHDGFTTYAPGILCALLAFGRMAAFAENARRRDLALAGLLLGIGACFKHDVAAYGAAACALTLLPGGPGSRAGRVATLLVPAAIPVAALVAWLVMAGAGPDLWQDLVVFPVTHFRHVRPESFPILPPLPEEWPWGRIDKLYRIARNLCQWAILHAPTIVLLCGLAGAWVKRAQLTRGAHMLVAIATLAYPLFWLAAHIQVNTHKVTLAALGIVVASVGLAGRRRLLVGICVVWALILAAEPFETMRLRLRAGVEPVGLPRLSAIWATHADAAWMRGLHRAMGDAAPADARLLFVGARNDVLVYADSTPYWLTDRRPAMRHHELHPGITDTEALQRRMLADLAGQAEPVVVREHRFSDQVLDHWGADFRSHGVPVGSRLLDEWIASRYRPGRRFGRYEVMERIR